MSWRDEVPQITQTLIRVICGLTNLLLRCDGRIVDYKRRLQRRVFSSEEVDPDCLSLEGSQIEGPQDVSGRLVQVRESPKSREHCVAGIANLYLQPVELGRGCRFSRSDLQPET